MKTQLNYWHDADQHRLEVFYGDCLIVELPYCDPMTDEEAGILSEQLFNEWLENQEITQ